MSSLKRRNHDNYDVRALVVGIEKVEESKQKMVRHRLSQIIKKDVKTAKNAFNRNNTNASLRIQYYKKFKEYKRTVKLKKRNYKHKLTNLLNEAMDKDPQTAWKIIDELKKNAVLQCEIIIWKAQGVPQ